MTPDLTDAAVEAAAEALGITLDDEASGATGYMMEPPIRTQAHGNTAA